MASGSLFRRLGTRWVAIGALLLATPAHAIEAFDGRFQLHGFFEEQIRAIDADFKENMDLTQWYHILNLEAEIDILPDGWGPITGLSGFTRVEVRYDCVWTRACGLFRSADTFGNRAGKLPVRLGNARFANLTGVSQSFGSEDGNPDPILGATRALGHARRAGGPTEVKGLELLFDVFSPDVLFDGRPYRPASDTTFVPITDYIFAMRQTQGGENGIGYQLLGPWAPRNKIVPNGKLRGIPNPFRSGDVVPNTFVPALGGPLRGSGELPYRPAPLLPFAQGKNAGNISQAAGLNYVSWGAKNVLQQHSSLLDHFDQNFTENELAWNRGASQQDEKELKEAYLDAELFDGQLLARLGKQTIVWGKTELFPTTDQLNPRDFALASLPSLEESRIALWAARFIYSFYNVGPLEDVRLEVALNLDDFEPDDLGRCGEPYTPNPVCNKTAGLFGHGLVGYGVIGEDRPPNWWEGWKGLQGGARVEWRWDRFSFAISDLYSYARIPYVHRISTYERNVDEITGRPREMGSRGSCTTGNEPACLTPGEALTKHSVNQSIFAVICSSSVGFAGVLDPTKCAQNVFNSDNLAMGILPITTALTNVLGGSPLGSLAISLLTGGASSLVPLQGGAQTLSTSLSVQQQALLGCGPFYSTSCDNDGMDLLNMEGNVLLQSMPGFEGTTFLGWRTNDASRAQPGTVGFVGGPIATRYMNGSVVTLPGARGPGDPGYDPVIDGIPTAVQPFTGQPFRTEMGMVSWNMLQILIAFSAPLDGGAPGLDEFDSTQQFRSNGCSFLAPQLCANVKAFFAVLANRRQTLNAGGNGRFGRRDFVWQGGGEVLLRYEKRNILGFSMDFADDVTKSNWGIESAWVEGLPYYDADKLNGVSKSSALQMTVSVDRPTFVNFLNANRTLFFNSQFFFEYITNYKSSFISANGPWNVLGTFTVTTGYFQDRLLPSVTFVYDVKSSSGAALPQIQYRFTENFSASVGVNTFLGRFQNKKMELEPVATFNQAVGQGETGAYHTVTEQGLSAIRDRDEVFLRLRYTF